MKDSVNQIHKAAMAINAQVLSEMEVPENYMESLPKVKLTIENLLIFNLADLSFFACDSI